MDLKNELAIILGKAIEEEDTNEVLSAIEIPPNKEMGDFAFACFKLAKKLRNAPQKIAVEIKSKIEKPDFIKDIKVEGAYINFYIESTVLAKKVIDEVLEKGESYGETNIGKGRNVVIDYSSPNIAKPFHVGHLRSTAIGNALYNIYNAIGYKSVGVNHLGDWGTQFGKLIVAYKKWGEKEAVEREGIQELNRIYVKFHEEAEKDEKMNDEARAWLVKMQDGDEEALELWRWFKDISMIEFERIYEKLGIKFDYNTGESFYSDKMDAVVEELREKELLTESNGAMIVDLEEENMPPCLILRSDGGTLYPTRDMATAFYRKREFDFAKGLYVTACDQKLHFAQFFEVLKKMGYEWANDLEHIPFGLVSLEEGKLSTRKGNVVLMEDLLNEAVQKIEDIIENINPTLENKKEIAKQVGIGAIIFNDLYNSRIKDVAFSWERMLNFEGETGPYVQYAHARACSILNRVEDIEYDKVDYKLLDDQSSAEIVKLIYAYPEKIVEAANKYEPFLITRHLVHLARAFNKFYAENRILDSEKELKVARLAIVMSVKTILASGLKMLGINAPEKM